MHKEESSVAVREKEHLSARLNNVRKSWQEISREADEKQAVRKERRELANLIRKTHWTNSPALTAYQSWFSSRFDQINELGKMPWLNHQLRKRRWTNNWMVRLLARVVFGILVLVIGLFASLFLFVVASLLAPIQLSVTYAKYLYRSTRELAAFDKRIADAKAAKEKAVEQAKRDEEARIQAARREVLLAEHQQLVLFWIAEFENASDETLLDVWATLQHCPPDHMIYYSVEKSPGPVLRQIVDTEVANRLISREARQLALMRLEQRKAEAARLEAMESLMSNLQEDAAARHSGVMNGLLSIAWIQMLK
jgi:hypothetical protein